MNVALVLPLFHEYGRRLRQGVLEWVDRHPGWRVIEIDPFEKPVAADLADHLHGVILWANSAELATPWLSLSSRIPVVDCSLGELASTETSARVTFARESINGLAVGHFRELGLEATGYVGHYLKKGGKLVPRVEGMRAAALAAGMEWICHDLCGEDPAGHPGRLWTGHLDPSLVNFLREAPKPIGLLAQDDYVGVMLCETATYLGIPVPGQLAVLGQGNRVLGQTGWLPLSSVIIPGREVGVEAARLLDEWMQGRPPQPRERYLPCRDLAVRRSTGGISLDMGIERARRHFDRHVLDGVTVQELAAIAKCSPKTLRSRFVELYGFDISATVRERRTEHALKLLAESDMEISEIGRCCGFASAPNFFNFVARQTGGIGPAEYRRQAKASAAADSESRDDR